ncbi:hypothetical protein ICW40_01525 [Actinotalea ferrariae]|uniref:S1 family peptidase n=1 Tax=Actinotalea ferrariae TaxID=1386098 RepID=UPI001C8B2EA4|nr:S1 family peptidase [Actinotalea ferrariae]MBX9243484.1 hypothetical protein [Actinotalea ferrariae]
MSSTALSLDEARRTKQEVAAYVRELTAHQVGASAAGGRSGVAVGLAPQPDGGYAVAVRYRLGHPRTRMVARRVAEQVGPAVDVRRTGRINAVPGRGGSDAVAAISSAEPADGAGTGGRDQTAGTGPRPPVVTALAAGETGRARPLRPGVSIAHVSVSAGTLGAFVRVSGRLHALSNYHVLVGSPSASIGDPVLQPGPADGGRDPQDRIGSLAAFVELRPGVTAVVDAAVALLDEGIGVDLAYPVGPVTEVADALGAEEVEKIGRTTGVTRGRITAIELDDVVVGYGEELGELSFDGQIEVESLGTGPFSRGGDSGSLVYLAGGDDRPGTAVGLLFAGSESGGENGTGLTYLNPIGAVLEQLGAELAVEVSSGGSPSR